MQNSTFEGQLTKTQLRKLTNQLELVLNPEQDHVTFYTIRNEAVFKKVTLGSRVDEPSDIL